MKVKHNPRTLISGEHRTYFSNRKMVRPYCSIPKLLILTLLVWSMFFTELFDYPVSVWTAFGGKSCKCWPFVTLLLFLFGVNAHLQTFKSQTFFILWCNYCEPVSSGRFLVDLNIFWYLKISIKYVISGGKKILGPFFNTQNWFNYSGLC